MNHKQNKFDIFLFFYFCSFSSSLISSWSVKHAANRVEGMTTEMAARMRMKERGVTHRSLCCSNKNGIQREIPPLAAKLNKKEQCAGP